MHVEDRFAIQDLLADYSFLWDAEDPERWARLFTPDGVWELYVPGIRPPVRRLTNVGERITAARTTFLSQVGRRTRFYHLHVRFDELDEERASVRCGLAVVELVGSSDAPTIRPKYTGTSSDQFRKTPVGWRFAKREIHSDQNPGFGNAQDFDSGADGASD